MPLDNKSLTKTIPFRLGEDVILRPLAAEDADILGDYFSGLSEATRQVYAPHPFDRETAARLCAGVGSNEMIRIVAVINGRIVGYFILVPGFSEGDESRYLEYGLKLSRETDCAIAPSLADDYQGIGLGPLILSHCRDIARQLGFKRMILSGGVRIRNDRAIAFYEKAAFREAGRFSGKNEERSDMFVDLADIP